MAVCRIEWGAQYRANSVAAPLVAALNREAVILEDRYFIVLTPFMLHVH